MLAKLPDVGELNNIIVWRCDDRAGEQCSLCHMQAHPLYEVELRFERMSGIAFSGCAICADPIIKGIKVGWPRAVERTKRVYAEDNPWGAASQPPAREDAKGQGRMSDRIGCNVTITAYGEEDYQVGITDLPVVPRVGEVLYLMLNSLPEHEYAEVEVTHVRYRAMLDGTYVGGVWLRVKPTTAREHAKLFDYLDRQPERQGKE